MSQLYKPYARPSKCIVNLYSEKLYCKYSAHMSEYAEDAYWPNLVSLFRVTFKTSCDFSSDFHGKMYVPIIYSCMLNHIGIKITYTRCPKKCVK